MSSNLLISSLYLEAVSVIFAAGPTNIGLIMPASALSTAPRSELSSQGCTTMVATAGTAFAAAIRRSYFACGRGSPGSTGMTLIADLQICSRHATTLWPGDGFPAFLLHLFRTAFLSRSSASLSHRRFWRSPTALRE